MQTSHLIFTLKHSCKSIAHIHQLHAQAITTALFSLYPSPLLSHILHSLTVSSPKQNRTAPSIYTIIYFTKIFDLIPNPSNFNYNDIIRAHTFLRSPHTALIFFLEMRRRQIEPNFRTFSFVLKASGLLQNSHSLAEALHAQVTKFGVLDDVHVQTALSCTYCRFGNVHGARGVFEGSLFRSVVSYNVMLGGFAKAGQIDHARKLFEEMPSSFRNVVSYTAMIDGFVKAGQIDRARKLFEEMPSSLRNVVSYTAMLHGFVKAGQIDRARGLFDEMPRSLRDVVSYTAMIDGLFKAGDIDLARGLFDEMPSSLRNVVSYNAMIDGLFKAGEVDRARELFGEMPNSLRDVVSYTAMIDGLVKAGEIDRAMELFDEMPSSLRNVVSYTAMIDGFFKVGEVDRARDLFDEIPSMLRNVLSYTAMIDGLAKAGEIDVARKLFDEMPSSLRNVVSYTVMIDGLFKAGEIDRARELFDEMSDSCCEKDVTLWNTMLMGLAIHGHGRSVLQYLSRMVEDGVKPDGVTILAVLVGCNHSGLINDAKRIFMEMESAYGVPREGEHYGCMVDLLARAGLIKEAREMIEGMLMGGNKVVWGALLGGCKKHGDVEVAEEAAKHLMQLKPEDCAVYSSLAHIYANLERWDDVVKVRRLSDCRGIKKRAGCCTIELDGITHKFFPGDRSHPCTKEIYMVLNDLKLHQPELLKNS